MACSFVFKGDFWYMLPYSPKELENKLLPALNNLESEVPLLIEIWVCGENTSYTLNKEYLNCPCPTNILSFPNEEKNWNKDTKEIFLGSLVLNAENLHREAALYHQSLEDHSLNLLAHGIAHLLGFDHGVDMDNFCQSFLQKVHI